MADLSTVASAKAYLGISGTGDDTLLASLVSAASTLVQTWLSRDIPAQAYDERYNGPGGAVLVLPWTPINSISLLTIDGVTVPAATTDGTLGYRFDDTMIVLAGYTFTRGLLNVRVQWNGGFTVIPPDLVQSVNELVALVYKESDRIGQTSKSIQGEVVSFFSGDLPPRIKTVLQQYKRVVPC